MDWFIGFATVAALAIAIFVLCADIRDRRRQRVIDADTERRLAELEESRRIPPLLADREPQLIGGRHRDDPPRRTVPEWPTATDGGG
jgi:hypothetical protein